MKKRKEQALFDAFQKAAFGQQYDELVFLIKELKEPLKRKLMHHARKGKRIIKGCDGPLREHEIINGCYTALFDVCVLHQKRYEKSGEHKLITARTLFGFISGDLDTVIKTWLFNLDVRAYHFMAPTVGEKKLSYYAADVNDFHSAENEDDCRQLSTEIEFKKAKGYIDQFPLIGEAGLEKHYERILNEYRSFRSHEDIKKLALYLSFIKRMKPGQILKEIESLYDKPISLGSIKNTIWKHQPVLLNNLRERLIDVYFSKATA